MEGNLMTETRTTRGRKGRMGPIVLLLAVVLLAVTNPSVDDFSNHMVKQIADDSENVLTRGIANTLGKKLIEVVTERDNYVVFSVFTMMEGTLPVKYIGILNGIFIKL